jgi:hypothetical protein
MLCYGYCTLARAETALTYAVVPLPYSPCLNVAPREAALIVHKILQIHSLQNRHILQTTGMLQGISGDTM